MTAGTFPPYTHTPGVTPHPVSDPAGHAFGLGESVEPWPVRQFADHPLCARGWELFSAGYYWNRTKRGKVSGRRLVAGDRKPTF